MRKRKILVIEDDAAIRQGLVDALEFSNYAVSEAGDGKQGLELAVKTDCDLVLLDLILPGLDGLDILREVRSVRPTLPVIVLTARGQEPERVQGLRLGADDYVVKPFSIKELLARIEAVLRRSPERPLDVQVIPLPAGTIDLDRHEVRFEDGGRQDLTAREVEILRYLACNAGRAIAREELLARVWRISPRAVVETRTIDMHIARLREKLRDDPAGARVIVTVKGRGYMLAVPDAAAEPQSNSECGMRNAE
jgi:DNA-binding response OmpR family regulator